MTEDFPNQEVFRAGRWNNDDYSISDLDAICEAADKVGFRIPIKVGHSETQELPAAGFVENVRRVGDKLVGDFKNVPRKIAELIKQGGFLSKSAEIYWNWQHGATGKMFPRVLKAVAILGQSIPAVSGLNDLAGLYDERGNIFRRYEIREETENMQYLSASDELNKKACAHMDATGLAYSNALKHIAHEEPELFYRYEREQSGRVYWDSAFGPVETNQTGASAKNSLGRILSGVQKTPGGVFDSADFVASFERNRATVEAAGAETLTRLRTQWIKNNGVPGQESLWRGTATKAVLTQHPELSSLLNGGAITPEVIATIMGREISVE